ncbi:MAG TPA: PEP-CTERM sorting domain-containing protein [Pyrinomonadaceae bacterium]|nr:PEP-CTERM sorting domain-containing protein [Pyrinomonadaceae bacterium]
MPDSFTKLLTFAGLLAMIVMGSQITARADGVLTNQGPVGQKGTGFGAVVNILSLQLQGGAGPSESGSITPSGRTGDATNTSQCATVAQLTAVGIDSTNLAFVFNINQTGGDPLVHLDDFTVNFYSSSGSLLFTASTAAGSEIDYMLVAQGTGGAGYLFTLTGIDQGTLAAFFANPDNCIGAVASVSGGVDDGPENFYATRTNAVQPIPEPATMTLFGLGLLGVASAVRKRRGRK